MEGYKRDLEPSARNIEASALNIAAPARDLEAIVVRLNVLTPTWGKAPQSLFV